MRIHNESKICKWTVLSLSSHMIFSLKRNSLVRRKFTRYYLDATGFILSNTAENECKKFPQQVTAFLVSVFIRPHLSSIVKIIEWQECRY